MTAIKEDVDEAIKEGVTIDYLTAPVEILGDGTRVTGVRCQRMQLGEADADGRRKVEPDTRFGICYRSRPRGDCYRSGTQYTDFKYQRTGYW